MAVAIQLPRYMYIVSQAMEFVKLFFCIFSRFIFLHYIDVSRLACMS